MKRGDRSRPEARTSKKGPLNSFVKFIKILALLFIVVQTLFLDLFPISDQSLLLRIFGLILYTLGLSIAITGRLHLGNNWANLEDYQILSSQKLVDKGIYGYIRHPIYTGDVLLLTGLELALNSWLVLGIVALIPIVIWQALAEESLLLSKLPGYSTYRSNTKMFIPFLI